MSPKRVAVPADSLIARYTTHEGAHVDAYCCAFPHANIQLERFISAFFRTPIFRVERKILAAFFKAPSSDRQILALAEGTGDRLAAWHVEARENDEILLAVGDGPIRTWLSVRDGTLWFGSVVLAGTDGRQSFAIRAAMPFHALYSRILLASARRALS